MKRLAQDAVRAYLNDALLHAAVCRACDVARNFAEDVAGERSHVRRENAMAEMKEHMLHVIFEFDQARRLDAPPSAEPVVFIR